MKSYPRSRRVADQMLREASILLDAFLEDKSFGLVSVTDVTISKDLRDARIYVSSLGSEESRDELLVYLKQSCKSFRSQLANRLSLKYMPDISFAYDASVERGMRIESLLTDIKNKDSNSGNNLSSDNEPH